ncbi:MAG: hypothetical protein AABW51_04845 [Nanoarchaeota archaeon]
MKFQNPEIHYFDGKATKVVQYSLSKIRGVEFAVASQYTLADNGSFTQWHEDFFYGTPQQRSPVEKRVLDFHASLDSNFLPVSLILEKSYDEVCKILRIKEKDIKIQHMDWKFLEVSLEQ